jgi:class 3 adenylate cyclase/tetratricopeptide (TPR) repeat protein
MTCQRCAFENPAAMGFCGRCGARLGAACPSCGYANPEGFPFCGKCGARVAEASPAPREGASDFTSPQSYTPRHLAEKILTSKAALEGERKQVTVLFADLKGSMELLADRDPEEARKLLDPVLERMMEAVHRYEGTVNQVMGDGIMALFGAPLAHEDHAVRACYAALQMQAAIRRYAEEVRRAHGVSLEIRVGLNSGEVVVRAIGSDLRMDYTAVGQTTHLAARMEQLATGGRTLLTADTLRLAEGYVEVTPLGPVPVKGLDTPVEVYELIGSGARRSRLSAAAARGLTRFVGRDVELEQLRQALGRAAAGHGQVVAIVGEPGVGKSRLVWEVTHSHRVHGWLVLQAGSVSYGKATSYLPVVDLLKGYFAIEDRDGPRAVREKTTGKLLTLERAQEASLPALLGLLDVPTGDPAWDELDPRLRRQRTLQALKQLLIRESQVQPLLVVFEDLHWIDGETQALLDALVESLPAARLLLLVNYRPEYQHQWGGRTSYTQLRLDPLPPASAEELLSVLLGPDAGFEPLKRMLIARTEGNPFFLEESVRTLVETGALSGERGAYRLTRSLPAIQVPATVQAILAARIDRLPPGDKSLLQTAAVIGKDVPFVLLQAAAGLAEDELRAAIGRLQGAEFLYETRLFPDLEYTFKHALTHEVAYGSLLQDRRRRLHGEIVDAIERLYPDRLSEHIDRLGHHAFRAERWEAAAAYLRQTGHKALSRSAFREAVTAYESALAAVERLPETRERQELVIDLRLDVRHPLQALQRVRRLLEGDRAAEAIALALGDERRLGRISSVLANTLWITGDHGAAIAAAERALDIGARLGDEAIHASAIVRLGAFHYTTGEYDKAIAYLRQGAELTGGERLGERLGHVGLASVIARFWLARTLTELGEFSQALTVAREAMDINLSTDVVVTLPAAHSAVGLVHLRRGELAEALLPLTRAVRVGEAAEVRNWESQSVGLLGLQHVLSGHPAEGVALLSRATGLAEERGEKFTLATLETWLGEAHLAARDPDRARQHAQASLEMARAQSQRGTEAWAWRLLGEIAAATDPPDFAEAESAYREALTRASDLGMRPLVAHCHLGLGQLHRRTGDVAKGREHLATALALYGDMGMRSWLEKAEAERTLLPGTDPDR